MKRYPWGFWVGWWIVQPMNLVLKSWWGFAASTVAIALLSLAVYLWRGKR